MADIALKLLDHLLEASGRCADDLRLRAASSKVRGENMRVKAEFGAVERDVDA